MYCLESQYLQGLEEILQIRVDKINTSVLGKYLAYLRTEKGLSAKTVDKHRTHFYALFGYLMSEEDVYGILMITDILQFFQMGDSAKTYLIECAKTDCNEFLKKLRYFKRHT